MPSLREGVRCALQEADKFFEEAAEEAERLQRTGPDVSSMPRDASGAVLLQGKGGSKPSGGSGLIL